MPVLNSDILFKLSVTTGTSGNSLPQGNVNNSLGRFISTTQIVNSTINNLFDNISGDENASSGVDYRCFFVHNSNSSGTLYSTVIWTSGQVAGGASFDLGLDPSGNTAIGSSNQAVTIAAETVAPVGVTFSNPVSKSGGLSIGDLSPNQCRAVWIRRTAANTSAVNNDGGTLRISGDSDA